MKKLVMLSLMLSSLAFAGELKGVKMADTVTVEGKELKLNGMGLRTKVIFKVYVAGLYLETKSKDPAAILAADGVRRIDLHMMRDLDKKAIVDAIRAGFEKNAGDKMPQLKDRLDKFMDVVVDLKEGEVLSLVYVPGKGTTIAAGGKSFTAEGKDFADALWSVYLGKAPVDEELKKGLLGG